MQAGPYASPDPAQEGSGLGPAVSRQPVRPPSPGPVGVSALLAAVRAVPGVRDAQVRTSADGDRTLRLDLADGADGVTVATLVSQVLDERLGVVVDPSRSFMVEDATSDEQQFQAPVNAPRRRVLMERLQVVTGGLDASVEVSLTSATKKVVGSATGPAVEAAVLRTVASAALNAVDALIEGRGRCGLDQAEVAEIGSDRVAVAVVTLLTPGQVDRLAGAVLVRGDARQAMVRAVLAALNRRLEALVPGADGEVLPAQEGSEVETPAASEPPPAEQPADAEPAPEAPAADSRPETVEPAPHIEPAPHVEPAPRDETPPAPRQEPAPPVPNVPAPPAPSTPAPPAPPRQDEMYRDDPRLAAHRPHFPARPGQDATNPRLPVLAPAGPPRPAP